MAVAAIEVASDEMKELRQHPGEEMAHAAVHHLRSAEEKEIKKLPRWYFGGLACMTGALCTHPLDMMKVHLQTHSGRRLHIFRSLWQVARREGPRRLYSGFSASVTREGIYSGIRFFIYEWLKPDPGQPAAPFYRKVATAVCAGSCGAFIGAPFDLINVRMLNDVKLPPEQRRHYRHVLDGLAQIVRHEGGRRLYNGASLVVLRGICITVGQLSFYDQVKQTLLRISYFEDNMVTHLLSSAVAACTAATLAMPVDVMKTRVQNSKPGHYTSIFHCAKEIAVGGPLAFYKGFIPALTRISIHTVVSFLTFEQLRIHFGADIL
ncbi:mitochondrial dicarboxylate carrier-like [Paramacrobiotus metropolitanus]|uniref:mitochondrial dicarboxylate carrier-like n=1 Tax=Paramacrobiotus metropolitanus TaxID=2943436 RepID=UPI002445E6F3|nr:mitochondrial dicarboxylate carrier-like [Paramacrobiotus metropolitanus]